MAVLLHCRCGHGISLEKADVPSSGVVKCDACGEDVKVGETDAQLADTHRVKVRPIDDLPTTPRAGVAAVTAEAAKSGTGTGSGTTGVAGEESDTEFTTATAIATKEIAPAKAAPSEAGRCKLCGYRNRADDVL